MKRVITAGLVLVLSVMITGCETPSQSATKRPDTMGSATAMLTGHRPTKKKKVEDDTKKMLGIYGSVAMMGGIYYFYETKGKRA